MTPTNTFINELHEDRNGSSSSLGSSTYFSNNFTNNKMNECLNNDNPIDLSKKVNNIDESPKQSEVITAIKTPANLLASLVSINDKVPTINSANVLFSIAAADSFLPQKYITDRALQDSKMKQSQISTMNNSNVVKIESPKNFTINLIEKKEEQICPPDENIQELNKVKLISPDFATTSTNNKTIDELSNKVNESTNVNALKPTTEGAKIVASEYIKHIKAHKNSRKEDDDYYWSDQEMIVDKPSSEMMSQTVVVGEEGFKKNPNSDFQTMAAFTRIQEDGRPVCTICSKTFQKSSQLRIHINIHYMERKYRCEPCAVSFRTQGHLMKHERSAQHQNKISVTSTFGIPSQSNPRPFKCKDCKVAFRIHGHLAKHLRCKLHVMKLECLQKIPFGTYAEIERAGISLTNIDTSDCDSSLRSLRELSRKLNEKDTAKLVTASSIVESDTEEEYSEENIEDETLENLQNEPNSRLKRKLSEIENSLDNSQLQGDENLNRQTNELNFQPTTSLQHVSSSFPIRNTLSSVPDKQPPCSQSLINEEINDMTCEIQRKTNADT